MHILPEPARPVADDARRALADLGVETYGQAVVALMMWSRRHLLSPADVRVVLARYPR
ncbi:hypothetical protein RB614_19695 [Phytohabitans sp. ZYX-F-186]|uniref:Uncharacterized protein n=1 Tax=Phytohabitans maris TaxID=3071409 RepID=A0ABU0ZIF5_9ACTN|nr:hypothetical protein [Phytohabitans sp. ZYX-F-186]MDQ7906743.1 hypothetical protein [Phytohabitans sp. ZYX-F-186]